MYHGRITKIRSRRNKIPWQGATISSVFFSMFIIFGRTPSYEKSSSSSTSISSVESRLSSSDLRKIDEFDVVVKCQVDTPFADPAYLKEREAFNPARGTIDILVHKKIAPLASDAFLFMVTSRHFDGNYFFRVVPEFIVQWGIESPDSEGIRRKLKFPKVDIDPPPSVLGSDPKRSNVRGTLNFAGGNASNGQVYVNKRDNLYLDKEKGSLPFATIDKKSMEIIDAIYNGYKQGIGQVDAVKKGDDEVKKLFPMMSRIEKCWIHNE
mmetsp:Transcript_31557/g.65948  ORF Transcript_31557/g.65948 Transcript_31557/m.65948 type:complete len:266 (+) Transcript_31557:238-1035(+)|eukprot:CAMPEP_0171362580 /NCGR_PEP_ID=MMETSP0879-20121228/2741_1 /TAXON_ID=67004 /ORGANISM="Thalassiosira weissflogii, Strain CCMP1336" /LENGTH=265 /DNA_ID=CAMNT_0011869493 /DNA_START=216 /DNA_END=1013 /DNA_ORIENTATION=+